MWNLKNTIVVNITKETDSEIQEKAINVVTSGERGTNCSCKRLISVLHNMGRMANIS